MANVNPLLELHYRKRFWSGAVTVTHLTPPLAASGLYKGLLELKDSLTRWRAMDADAPERDELERLINDQAEAVDMGSISPDALWLKLLETEDALIPDGLHIVGQPLSDKAREDYLNIMTDQDPAVRARIDALLRQDSELEAISRALSARFIEPAPGGDLIRSTDVLPTGRNIHAFDPFRMPTAFACQDGAKQAKLLLETHATLPRTVALVLWGSDTIKSDGGPIAQALALMGWLGIPLDNSTLLVGCVIIGLAVDDTIHFMHRFQRYFVQTGDAREAVRLTLQTTGSAMLFTSMALASGFFVDL